MGCVVRGFASGKLRPRACRDADTAPPLARGPSGGTFAVSSGRRKLWCDVRRGALGAISQGSVSFQENKVSAEIKNSRGEEDARLGGQQNDPGGRRGAAAGTVSD